MLDRRKCSPFLLSVAAATVAAFASATARAGLIAYYSFDGTTAATLGNDNSGNGLNLTPRTAGGDTAPAPTEAGRINGAASFAGTVSPAVANDFSIATSSIFPASTFNFSISFSVKPTSTSVVQDIARSSSNTVGGGMSFTLGSGSTANGDYYFNFYGVNGSPIASINSGVSAGTSTNNNGFDDLTVTYADPGGALDPSGSGAYIGLVNIYVNGASAPDTSQIRRSRVFFTRRVRAAIPLASAAGETQGSQTRSPVYLTNSHLTTRCSAQAKLPRWTAARHRRTSP